MIQWIKQWWYAGVASVAAAVAFLVYVLRTQRDRYKAQAKTQERRAETAEERGKQRKKADKASRSAKEKGNEVVKQNRKKARSGDRSHFSRGMRDN